MRRKQKFGIANLVFLPIPTEISAGDTFPLQIDEVKSQGEY